MDTPTLRDLAARAENVVERLTFFDGFEVELRRVSRSDLDQVAKYAIKKVRDRTGQVTPETDPKKFREALRDKCLLGWTGLTFKRAVESCNKAFPAEMNGLGETAVPFTPDNALWMLEEARGTVLDPDSREAQVMSFDDWVFQQATRIAQTRAAEEARKKNG